MIHLRPSGAYIWTRCAAAPSFQSRVPEQPESDEAREGTCAAWLAEQTLNAPDSNCADYLGKTHANGWTVTPDMVQHVQGYVDVIRSRGGVIEAETYVRLTEFIAGTLDNSSSVTGLVLHVDDLKYGMKWVEIVDNPQVIIYAAAKLLKMDVLPEKVVLSIYQPRAFHPDGIHREWTLTVPELWEAANWIIERGQACQSPTPIATPGAHCHYCSAASSCGALAATNYQFYEVMEGTQQRTMTKEELARELDFLDRAEKVLKARTNNVRAEAEQRLSTGEFIPGWHMERGKGNRQFTVDATLVELLTGISPYERKVVTPAELERRGANVEIVKHIAKSADTAPKLKRIPAKFYERLMGNGKRK